MKPRYLSGGLLSLIVATGSSTLLDAASTTADNTPAYQSTSPGINFNNADSHTTTGNNSDAVRLDATAGDIIFYNSGTLTTGTQGNTGKGSQSRGILATATGSVSVENRGNITTHGMYAAGISAYSSKVGNVTVTHGSNMTIKTTGSQNSTGEFGSWPLGHHAAGIIAYNQGSGDTIVNAHGHITTTGAGNRLFGIFSHSQTGSSEVVAGGNITVGQKTAAGTALTNSFTGTQYNQGIHSEAAKASTVKYYSNNLTTYSDYSMGIFSASTGTGISEIHNLKGTITTHGAGSTAIRSEITNAANSARALAYNTGTILTKGGSRLLEFNGNQGYSRGMVATTQGSGNATLKTGSTSSVTTEGDHAEAIYGYSAKGDVWLGVGEEYLEGSATTKGHYSDAISGRSAQGKTTAFVNATVTTAGTESRGIRVEGKTEAHVRTGTGSIIRTTGSHSQGIYANSSTGTVWLGTAGDALKGTITTGGTFSEGIWGVNGTGAVNIHTASAITTSGTYSAGVRAAASGHITINHTGRITTEKVFSAGISANIDSGSGNITVTHAAGAEIKTTATQNYGSYVENSWWEGNYSAGIIATTKGSGAVNITSNGTINTTGQGNRLFGIFASSATNSTTVNATGNITVGQKSVSGTAINHTYLGTQYNEGIHAEAGGNSTINYSTGKVTTNSDRSNGLFSVTTGTGTARVNLNSGEVLTEGDGSVALYAAVTSAQNSNDATVYTNGTVTTRGRSRLLEFNDSTVYSHAVLATNAGSGKSIATTGTNSRIETHGDSAHGVYVRSASGMAQAGTSASYLTGSITTHGTGSHGIQALTDSGTAQVYNAATVSASGTSADGVRISSTSGRGDVYNTGSISGYRGVHILNGVSGGTVRNRGTIEGSSGNAIVLSGSNMVIDVTTTSVETGAYVSNNTGNSILLGGASSSRTLNHLAGSHYFDSITKTGRSQWIIDSDITLSGSASDSLNHREGRLVVEGDIAFASTTGLSTIHSGATLSGTGGIHNDVIFQSGAILEVDLLKAYNGECMAVSSGSLDGIIRLVDFAPVDPLEIDTYLVVLESTDLSGLTGSFDWLEGEQRAYGHNLFEMRYTGNEVQLWVTDHVDYIPEPATATLSVLGAGMLLLRRGRRR